MKRNFLFIAIFIMAITLQTTKVVAQQFIIGSNNNVTTTTVVIPVTCIDFLQFPAWQGSINWDNTKLTYASVATVATQLTGASYNASISGTTGRLSFIWVDNNTNPQTIPDNTVLFNITFNVVPLAIGITDITFTNTPTDLLLSNASFEAVSGVTYTKGTVNLVAVLPLNLLSFTATPQNNTILAQWQTINEVNVSHINVQRSTDGSSFITVGSSTAKGGGDYSYTDAALPVGVNKLYYRLESVDKDGSIRYSVVREILFSSTPTIVALYPNPIVGNSFTIDYGKDVNQPVEYYLYDANGKLVKQGLLVKKVQTVTVTDMAQGRYVVKLADGTVLQFVK